MGHAAPVAALRHRKDFTPSEAVRIGAVIEEQESERLAQKKAQSGGVGNKKQKTNGSGKLPEPFREQSRDIAAKYVGMRPRSYDKAKAVVRAAHEDPECASIVEAYQDSWGHTHAVARAQYPVDSGRTDGGAPVLKTPQTRKGTWSRIQS